jgi:hypothetical protein
MTILPLLFEPWSGSSFVQRRQIPRVHSACSTACRANHSWQNNPVVLPCLYHKAAAAACKGDSLRLRPLACMPYVTMHNGTTCPLTLNSWCCLVCPAERQQQRAKETEATAELDNQGLVQLQQQVMQHQDHELEQIEKTVVSTKVSHT